MALTPAQLATFASDIENNTNQTVIDALAVGNGNGLRDWYNSTASPAFYLWRAEMSVEEMKSDHFDWSEVVGLGTSALLALQTLTNQDSVNPSRASIRAAFTGIFSGPGAVNTRTALSNAAKRTASNVQKLFADTSGGNGALATPAIAVVEAVTIDDIAAAIQLIGG